LARIKLACNNWLSCLHFPPLIILHLGYRAAIITTYSEIVHYCNFL
jgi:hypothetical protein